MCSFFGVRLSTLSFQQLTIEFLSLFIDAQGEIGSVVDALSHAASVVPLQKVRCLLTTQMMVPT